MFMTEEYHSTPVYSMKSYDVSHISPFLGIQDHNYKNSGKVTNSYYIMK